MRYVEIARPNEDLVEIPRPEDLAFGATYLKGEETGKVYCITVGWKAPYHARLWEVVEP